MGAVCGCQIWFNMLNMRTVEPKAYRLTESGAVANADLCYFHRNTFRDRGVVCNEIIARILPYATNSNGKLNCS